MADKLIALRSEAKVSMANLLSKSMLRDEAWLRRRSVMQNGSFAALCVFILPWAAVWFYGMWEMGNIHQGYRLGIDYTFLRGGASTREIYRPEVYARERKVRPYECTQFTNFSW